MASFSIKFATFDSILLSFPYSSPLGHLVFPFRHIPVILLALATCYWNRCSKYLPGIECTQGRSK